MLAEIGIMIGLYIMTRMLAMERNKDGSVSQFARVFGVITFVVAVVIVADLLIRGILIASTATGA